MADTQSAKARALIDPDVLTLGATAQRTRKGTNPVVQNNMSAEGPASPQPGLTPKVRVFAKGGKASGAGKMKKAAQVAGLLSALSQAPQGPAPAGMGAPPMAGPPMGAPGMKKGGRRMAMGGRATDDEGDEMRGMKRGGHAKKPAEGSAAEERGESKKFEASEDEGAGMKRGGKCMRCGGKAHGGACKMARGGYLAPRNKQGRVHLAMGGVPGKMRKGVMTPAGLPTKPTRKPGNLI